MRKAGNRKLGFLESGEREPEQGRGRARRLSSRQHDVAGGLTEPSKGHVGAAREQKREQSQADDVGRLGDDRPESLRVDVTPALIEESRPFEATFEHLDLRETREKRSERPQLPDSREQQMRGESGSFEKRG